MPDPGRFFFGFAGLAGAFAPIAGAGAGTSVATVALTGTGTSVATAARTGAAPCATIGNRRFASRGRPPEETFPPSRLAAISLSPRASRAETGPGVPVSQGMTSGN